MIGHPIKFQLQPGQVFVVKRVRFVQVSLNFPKAVFLQKAVGFDSGVFVAKIAGKGYEHELIYAVR